MAKKITELVAEVAAPVAQEQGCTLWDVEYVREAGQWYLRLYLDKDGGVDILDCGSAICWMSWIPSRQAISSRCPPPERSGL